MTDLAPTGPVLPPRRTAIGKTPLERIEYAIIVSTLLAMVVLTVQPILNLLAISFSDNARVPGMSGLAIWPSGFSTDVWNVLIHHPSVQRGMLNSIGITAVGTLVNVGLTTLMAWGLSRSGLPGRRVVYVLVLVTNGADRICNCLTLSRQAFTLGRAWM